MWASNGIRGRRWRRWMSVMEQQGRGAGSQGQQGARGSRWVWARGKEGADFSTSNHSLTPLPPISLLALEMVCNPSANDFASLLPPCFSPRYTSPICPFLPLLFPRPWRWKWCGIPLPTALPPCLPPASNLVTPHPIRPPIPPLPLLFPDYGARSGLEPLCQRLHLQGVA